MIKDPKEVETHFVKFESLVNEYEIKLKTIFNLLKERGGIQELNFKDWVITDLDNYLNGNPHVNSWLQLINNAFNCFDE